MSGETPTMFQATKNGRLSAVADWPLGVQQQLKRLQDAIETAGLELISVNYFTPRPYQDEYERGSKEAGFVYSLRTGQVGQILFIKGERTT